MPQFQTPHSTSTPAGNKQSVKAKPPPSSSTPPPCRSAGAARVRSASGTASTGSTPGSRPTTPGVQRAPVTVPVGAQAPRSSPVSNTGRFTTTAASGTTPVIPNPTPTETQTITRTQTDVTTAAPTVTVTSVTTGTSPQLNGRTGNTNSNQALAETTNVAISTTGVPIMVRRRTTEDDEVSTVSSCVVIHRGNCCVHTRRCLESSAFSFTLGRLCWIFT